MRTKGSTVPLESRFRKKVDKSGECWNWTGCESGADGKYGGINILGKKKRVHRVSYEIHIGPIPEGSQVCHHCDNPKCVRPDHLFLGTAKDNNQGCIAKGRRNFQINPDFMPHGTANRLAKLTEKKIWDFRIRYLEAGESLRSLAKEAGVCRKTLKNAIDGKTWRHAA